MTPAGRASAVYEGTLSHARHAPRRHAFGYRVWLLYLDLDELPALLAGPGPLREGRLGLLSFRRSDYLGGAGDLAEAARARVEAALGFRPAGPAERPRRTVGLLNWAMISGKEQGRVVETPYLTFPYACEWNWAPGEPASPAK